MREAILIKNVGPIREVEIDDIKPLTVFIGASASGKSTIMKVIALMRYIYKMVNIRSYLKDSNISKSPFRLRFDTLLHDGLDKMVSSQSEICYTVAFARGSSYSIEYKDRKLKANVLIESQDFCFFKESFIAESRSVIPQWASRLSSNRGAKLGFYFQETFGDFDEATDALKEQTFEHLGLSMRVQKGSKHQKEFQLQDTGKTSLPFELHNASSGIQTSVPLMVLLRYFAHSFSFKDAFKRSVLNYLFVGDRLSDYRPSIVPSQNPNYVHIHIEEPELSLDPPSQIQLLHSMVHQALHDTSTDRKLGLMIATHSPYIVSQLNVYLKASYRQEEHIRSVYPIVREEDIAVYCVSEGTIHSLVARRNTDGQAVINALDLSDPMARIYEEYSSL